MDPATMGAVGPVHAASPARTVHQTCGRLGLGLGLDLALGTYGHHMVAGTVLGGFLPSLHRLLAPREGYEVTQRPTLGPRHQLGPGFHLPRRLVFHLTLAVVDTWHAHLLPAALLPAVTSAGWTTVCCLLLHLLAVPGRSKTA